MIPHDYQAQAADVTVSSLQACRQALVIMATGLGKTLVAALVNRELRQDRGRFRNLVVCHDTDILEQSEPTFRSVLGDSVEIGYFNGETKEGADAEIVFSTFQTLREWKNAFFPDEFDLVTIDEAHHSQAMTYKDVIEYFSGVRLGLTAIRDRMDGKDIAEIFGEPVVSIPLEEAMLRGLLTPFEYRIVSDGLNTEVVRAVTREIASGKRFTLSDVNKRLFIETRDDEIVRRIKREAGSRKTLVFCRNIRHADHIAEMLGPLARSYHSDATRAVNRDTLNAFRAGVIQFLVTVNKANEGVDIPDAEVVVFLRTTDSKTVFFEQLGRSLRKLPSKKKALILDFVGNVERIVMLQDMVRKIGQNLGLFKNDETQSVSVSGSDFEFNFSETIVEVLNLVARLSRDFYPTWQEAAIATQRLRIQSSADYHRQGKYRADPRLPSNPDMRYANFPGWIRFLGDEPRDYYPTWRTAAAAARQIGITSEGQYRENYKKDALLPGAPYQKYKDFPGWAVFFGKEPKKKNHYSTWSEAAAAARSLSITSERDYDKKYKQDPRLPARPHKKYKEDFPGWVEFLGKRTRKSF